MEPNKLNMNLQYFADVDQAGSQSQPGAQGGDNGESGQNTDSNTQSNSNNQNGQSANDFIQNLVDSVTKQGSQSSNKLNNGSNGDQVKDDQPSSSGTDDVDTDDNADGKKFTQAEVDKLLKEREFRAHKKGIEEGKEAGKTSAEKYAQMTDKEKEQAQINDILNENKRLKAERNRSDMRDEVLKQLKDTGYQFTNDDVDALVNDNPDKTKHNVDNFKSMINRIVKKTKQDMFKNHNVPQSNQQQNAAAPSFGELVAKHTLGDPSRFKGKFFDQK
uniref:DUF4355 domain-containing protein n=1 Tax=Lentilactobacillus hilgardii TaxID=1588 RepID=UPI00403FA33F